MGRNNDISLSKKFTQGMSSICKFNNRKEKKMNMIINNCGKDYCNCTRDET